MVLAEESWNHVTTRVGPATTLVIDGLRSAQNTWVEIKSTKQTCPPQPQVDLEEHSDSVAHPQKSRGSQEEVGGNLKSGVGQSGCGHCGNNPNK